MATAAIAETTPASVPAPRWRLVVDGLLAVPALVLAVAAALSVVAQPFGGMRAPAYLAIWVLGFLGLNRGLALLQDLARGVGARRALRIAKWLLPFVVPVLTVRFVEEAVLDRQMRQIESALAPVVAFANGQTGASTVDGLPAVAFPVPVYYLPSDAGYALWLTAPSIDVDGYLLRYDAGSGAWQRAHNDDPEVPPEPDRAAACTLAAGSWRCPGAAP